MKRLLKVTTLFMVGSLLALPVKAGTPTVDLIFILDTSGSMSDEASSLQSAIQNIESSLATNSSFNIKFKTLAISPVYDYTCNVCEGSVYETIPNSSVNQYEDWGPAVYDMATKYTGWDSGAIKVLVPISDEGPQDGDPVDSADEAIAQQAAKAAEDNNVYVIPVLGSGADSEVEKLATIMAGKTGKVLKTTTGTFTPEQMESAIEQIIAEAYGGYVFLKDWEVTQTFKGIKILIKDAPGAEKYAYQIYSEDGKWGIEGVSYQTSIVVDLPKDISGNLTVKINAYGKDFSGNEIESGWQEKTITFSPITSSNQINVCSVLQNSLCSIYNAFTNANISVLEAATGSIQNVSTAQRLVQEPVDVATGNWVYHHTDFVALTAGLPFKVVRYYNSISGKRGWYFNLEASLDLSDLNNIVVYWPGGSVDKFTKTENAWKSPYTTDRLYSSEGYFVIEKLNGIKYYFDSNGKLVKVTDKKGNGYTYEYSGSTIVVKDTLGNLLATITKDSEGRIVSIEDAKGNEITYTYDTNGNLVSYTDRNGKTTTYEYDTSGLITKVIGPDGNAFVENEYDSEGRVIKQKDGSGNITTFEYDPVPGTLISATTIVTYPDGTVQTYKNLNTLPTEISVGDATVKYEYDANNQLSKVIDPNGKEWKYERNNDGLITKAIDPAGNVYEYTYDDNGNLIAVKDPNGKVTTYTYDENNNLVKITLPDGNSTTIEYNAQNLPTKITDPLGNSIEYAYNTRELVSSVKLPNGATYSYEYDELGNVVKVTDPLGRETTYTYDNEGRLIKITNPAGYETKFEYNAYGDLIKVTDPKGRTVQMEYNVDGLLTKITLPDGRTIERKYDALGRVIETKDELGRVTKFDYDELGRLSKVTDPKGNVFSFVYDKVGNLIKVVDAKGNEVKTDYDELYRPSKFYDAYGKLVSQVQYNSVSLPIKVEDSVGRSLEFVYDSLYRLQETTLSGNIKAKAVYDALGRIVKVIDPKGYETSYQYDALGNLVKEINPLGKEWNYQYDSIGRLIKSIDPNGNTATYTYDNLDRITKITLSSADGNQTKEITYTYDEVGNVLSVADDVGKIEYKYDINDRVTERKDVFGNVVKYVYDTAGRLSKLIYPDNKTVEYFYDEDDNLIKVKDWAGRETTFEYDANGNLVKVNYPNGAYTTYEYDANDRLIAVKNYTKGGKLITSNELQRNDAGDITHITRVDYVKPDLSRIKPNHFTYNEFNQIVSSDEGEFTYDDNGNLLSYTYNGKKIKLSYDLTDRLVEAQIGNDTYEYTYDAEGNRVAVTKNGETKRYLIDNVLGLSKPLAEMDENNNILRYYIWTANGLTYSVDKDGHIYVYFYDYKGNTNAVIDENNQLVAAYTYSAYGKILGSYEKTGFENPFKFLGKFGIMADSNELYYVRARYYSPDLARWTQLDILRGGIASPLSLNRYAYNEGDAVNFVDITGLNRERSLINDVGNILNFVQLGLNITNTLQYATITRKLSKANKVIISGFSNALFGTNFDVTQFIKGSKGFRETVRRFNNFFRLQFAKKIGKISNAVADLATSLTFYQNAEKNADELFSEGTKDLSVATLGKYAYHTAIDTIIDIPGGTLQFTVHLYNNYIYVPFGGDKQFADSVEKSLKEGVKNTKEIVKKGIDKVVDIVSSKISDALVKVYNPYQDNSIKGRILQWIGNKFFR